jgi:hypothetical protein
MIHTGSRITLESLKNNENRNYLIEEIRKKTNSLETENWTVDKGTYRTLWKRARRQTR